MAKKKHHWRDVLKGKAAEYEFASQCSKRGLLIHFPATEMIPWDYIIANEHTTLKIQVKSTDGRYMDTNRYMVSASGPDGKYQEGDFDFLAAYIRPIKAWYLVPFSEITGTSMYFHESGKYEQFRNKWKLLKDFKK